MMKVFLISITGCFLLAGCSTGGLYKKEFNFTLDGKYQAAVVVLEPFRTESTNKDIVEKKMMEIAVSFLFQSVCLYNSFPLDSGVSQDFLESSYSNKQIDKYKKNGDIAELGLLKHETCEKKEFPVSSKETLVLRGDEYDKVIKNKDIYPRKTLSIKLIK